MEPIDRRPASTRILIWAVVILFAAWGAAELFGSAFDRGSGLDSPELIVAFAALGTALMALAIASLAVRSAKAARRDLNAVSLALDAALRTQSGKSNALGIGEINAMVAREVERLSPRADAPPALTVVASTETETVVRTARKPRNTGHIEAAMAEAIAAGRLEISLRPVVSLARGAAVAFDAFAHFENVNGSAMDVGRVHERSDAVDQAAFERLLVVSTATTARRMLGAQSDQPVHIPISEALLTSRKELSAVLAVASAHPAAASAVVLDLPWHTLATRNTFGKALDKLVDAGFALAAEAGDAGAIDPQALGGQAKWVRLQTPRLLGRRNLRGRAMSGHELADAMREAGLGVIADEVQNDDDAIALVDVGVDLMTGARFSGPRRLRAEPGLPDPVHYQRRDAAE